MSLLFNHTIHVPSASAPIEYKVFGDGSKEIMWLFYEPKLNMGTSITNSIEMIFSQVLPALCRAVEADYSGYISAKARLELDSFFLNVLGAAARGFPMFSDATLVKDLVSLLKALGEIYGDGRELVAALKTGPVFQHIPSECSILEGAIPYVQRLPVNGFPDLCGDWPTYTVARWEEINMKYQATV